MKRKFKALLLALLSIVMVIMVGCGNNSNNNSSNNSTDSTKTTSPTNQEYYNYLTDRYNYYFTNNPLFNDEDIYVDDFTYNGTYEEFITTYNNSYDDLKINLEAFKNDLQNNVVKGNAEVDKYNQEVISDVDKAIIAVDDYTGSFADKAKDYATLSKDEVVKGLRNIGLGVHDAKTNLDNLIHDAKNQLGIQ